MNRNPERKKKTFVENFWRHFLRPKCTFVCVYVWIVEGWEQDIVSQTLEASSKHTYSGSILGIPKIVWKIANKPWIERDHDFTFQHLRERWNPWTTIFAVIRDYEWKIIKMFVCLYVKSLKFLEFGVNRIS